jgi:catechol 2,3-dioxygenase-like lactoylglutathione lyase family enzyme
MLAERKEANMVDAKANYLDCHCALWTQDFDRMVDFYENVVGLPRIYTAPNWTLFPLVQLFRPDEGHGSGPGTLHHVGIAVDNLEEVVERLAAHGVEFENPLRAYYYPEFEGQAAVSARWVFFRDPDGNRVELVQVDWPDGHPHHRNRPPKPST